MTKTGASLPSATSLHIYRCQRRIVVHRIWLAARIDTFTHHRSFLCHGSVGRLALPLVHHLAPTGRNAMELVLQEVEGGTASRRRPDCRSRQRLSETLSSARLVRGRGPWPRNVSGRLDDSYIRSHLMVVLGDVDDGSGSLDPGSGYSVVTPWAGTGSALQGHQWGAAGTCSCPDLQQPSQRAPPDAGKSKQEHQPAIGLYEVVIGLVESRDTRELAISRTARLRPTRRLNLGWALNPDPFRVDSHSVFLRAILVTAPDEGDPIYDGPRRKYPGGQPEAPGAGGLLSRGAPYDATPPPPNRLPGATWQPSTAIGAGRMGSRAKPPSQPSREMRESAASTRPRLEHGPFGGRVSLAV